MARKNQSDYDRDVMMWLGRFEKRFGVNQTRESLQKLESARALFFNEIGYNITRKQFEHLAEAKNEEVQADILAGVKTEQLKNKQVIKRDIVSGKFAKQPAVESRNQRIRDNFSKGVSRKELAKQYQVSYSQIKRIVKISN